MWFGCALSLSCGRRGASISSTLLFSGFIYTSGEPYIRATDFVFYISRFFYRFRLSLALIFVEGNVLYRHHSKFQCSPPESPMRYHHPSLQTLAWVKLRDKSTSSCSGRVWFPLIIHFETYRPTFDFGNTIDSPFRFAHFQQK